MDGAISVPIVPWWGPADRVIEWAKGYREGCQQHGNYTLELEGRPLQARNSLCHDIFYMFRAHFKQPS